MCTAPGTTSTFSTPRSWAAYLSLLDQLYEEWTSSFDLCPVLTIQSDAVDFVNREEQLEIVMSHVLDRLMGSEKIVLD